MESLIRTDEVVAGRLAKAVIVEPETLDAQDVVLGRDQLAIDVLAVLFRHEITLVDANDESVRTGQRRVGSVIVVVGLHWRESSRDHHVRFQARGRILFAGWMAFEAVVRSTGISDGDARNVLPQLKAQRNRSMVGEATVLMRKTAVSARDRVVLPGMRSIERAKLHLEQTHTDSV